MNNERSLSHQQNYGNGQHVLSFYKVNSRSVPDEIESTDVLGFGEADFGVYLGSMGLSRKEGASLEKGWMILNKLYFLESRLYHKYFGQSLVTTTGTLQKISLSSPSFIKPPEAI